MRIGELARRTGLPVITLRYYENEGLIESRRSHGNYREFTEEMVQRVRTLQRFRALDLTIAEMKQMLDWSRSPRECCQDACCLLRRHLHDVSERKQILIELESELQRLLDACSASDAPECGVLRELTP